MKTLNLTPFEIAVPVRLKNGNKSVTISAIVDTGATTTVVDMKFARRLGLTLKNAGHVRLVQGVMTEFYSKVERFEILNPVTKKLVCAIDGLKISVGRFGSGLDMLLGADVLKFFKAKVDFQKQAIIWNCKSAGELVGAMYLGRALGSW